LIALLVLAITFPILLIAAIGIKVTSRGPVLYQARRIGRERRGQQRPGPYLGREFTMYKLRTMHADQRRSGMPITASDDDRIFPWGRLLRKLKIDELPQLLNVIKGDMSLVGPRPEAPEVVQQHYGERERATLKVPPGVTSPGTLYYYTHCEQELSSDSVMSTYVDRVLPRKLDVDRIYIENASLTYDVRVLLRTAKIILGRVIGVRRFSDPPELRKKSSDVSHP
jgi:lipopolysaccharide/colanic/teichoic acid biosynthesis glycosyltransferase